MERSRLSQQDRDGLQAHAERLLADRQGRFNAIDEDLLGEPGWDILLMAYIAICKGELCHLDEVAQTTRITSVTARRWIKALEERGFLEFKDPLLALSAQGEVSLTKVFHTELRVR